MTVPLFDISGIQQIAADAFDTLILQFGKPCRLIYPAMMVPCPQGCPTPVGAKQATDVWRTGGMTKPGNISTCAVCGGTGQITKEQTEEITLLCDFDVKPWNRLQVPQEVDFRVPGGFCQTKGFLTDMPKVLRCQSAVLNTKAEPYLRYTYKLLSEPIENYKIVQGRYFQALWQRAG